MKPRKQGALLSLVCPVCGAKFKRYRSQCVTDQPCCSRRCGWSSRDARHIKESRAHALPPPVRGARWIPLTRGLAVLVDADDFDRLVAEGPWSAHANTSPGRKLYYAAKRPRVNRETMPIVFLHRVVMNAKPDEEVDHRDGNTLDSRKKNLRLAGQNGNSQNRGKHRGSKRPYSSKYKGVCRPDDYRKWKAVITIGGKSKWLRGAYETEEEAARVYDDAARAAFGEFACVNFPRKGERSALR